MATIKISQLPSIGNAVAANTLLPVVNTAGVYTTDKASVGNIGNFVLTQAGNTLPAAFLSTYSQTVTNAAQPNITSTGTLSNLTVSGNAYIGNISSTGYTELTILNVGSEANLGDVGNLTIGGGLNGYVLQTDGGGNLSWTAQTGGGGGNATPGGSNTQIQFNDSGNFAGNSGFTFNKNTNLLTVGNVNVTSNLSADYANLTHDLHSNVVYGNYLYGDGSNITNLPVGNISSVNLDGNVSNILAGNGTWITKASISGSPSGSNTQIQYNNNGSFGASSGLTYNNTTSTLTAGNIGTGNLTTTGIVNVNNNQASINPSTGAVKVTGGVGVQGNIHGGGEIHSFGNMHVGGQSLFVGPTADATGLTAPTLVIFHSGNQYIQAALKNSLGNGSADWVSYGDNGTEEQGWMDMGFTGSTFNDANYTITGAGDGYLFAQTYTGSYGGNLVLATGDNGTFNDIIFATGGFNTSNEFARIEHANNLLHLTRSGSGIKFDDGSIQTTAFGLPLANGNSNFDIATANGNITITANTSNTWTFGDDGTLLLPRDVAGNTDPYLWITGGPAPSISSVDVSLAGPANFQIVSDYLNLSGYSGAKVAIKADNGEIATDANMVLTTNGANVGNTYSWTFDTTGNFNLANGNSVIQSVPNNAGDGSGLSTLNLIPDNSTGDDRYLIVDPTGPSHLHLRAGGDIDASNVLLYLGGEQTYVQIDDGYHRVSINSYDIGNTTGYNWRFDFDGNLVLPGNTFAVKYANGTTVSLGGGYGDSNVVTLLSSFGSNTITTTGNVSVGNIAGSTNGYTIGYLNIPQVAASNTTLVLGDAGKHYYSTTAGNLTLTIPNNATTSFATGTAISIVVQAAGNVLVNAASGVTLYMAGSSSAGNRVVGTYGMATLMKVASDTWFINGTGVY